MSRQRHQRQLTIAEHIHLPVEDFHLQRMIPVRLDVSAISRVIRVRGLDLERVNEDRCLLEEAVAAAMIGVQVRADHHVDIVGAKANRLHARQHMIVGRHDRLHIFGKRAEPPFGIGRDIGMASGVEQHIALRMPQQHAGDRQIDHLAARHQADRSAWTSANARPTAYASSCKPPPIPASS